MKSTICIAEDREKCEPAIKLLLLSLGRHCPGKAVNLFYPPAKDGFLAWLKRCPEVCLQTVALKNGFGWNVKPQAVMQLMDAGYDEVIWIDSDIIVNRDILSNLSALKRETLVATEHTLADERSDRDALRARLWGLPVGRVLPLALSSGVVRATKDHYHLMERWWTLLQSSTYQNFQKRGWNYSPIHMLGDQDVLTALLTSKEFSEIPIHVLQRGRDIIQFDGVFGYTVAERVTNLLGDCPAFVHSGAAKPWAHQWQLESPSNVREHLKEVYLDLSPYTLSALPFRRQMECDTDWMDPHYALSRVMRKLGMGTLPMVGLPMAVFADVAYAVRCIGRSKRIEELIRRKDAQVASRDV